MWDAGFLSLFLFPVLREEIQEREPGSGEVDSDSIDWLRCRSRWPHRTEDSATRLPPRQLLARSSLP